MTIKEKSFLDLSKKEIKIEDKNWVIDVDKPTICVFLVSWIDDPVNWNRLQEEPIDWNVLKVDASEDEELIMKFGISTFPSYCLLFKGKPPRLISAYMKENDLISYFHYYLSN